MEPSLRRGFFRVQAQEDPREAAAPPPRTEAGTVRDEGRHSPTGLVGGREAAPAVAGAVRTSLS